MLRGSRAFSGKIHRPFLAQVVPPFTTRGSGGDLVVQVGTTKDQGLYNKPSASVHPWALAYHNTIQYNTIQPTKGLRTACNLISSNRIRPNMSRENALLSLSYELCQTQATFL